MTAQLASSIDNLFKGKLVAESNAFIQQYSECVECWASATALLAADQAYIRFFSANILLNKVGYLICTLLFTIFTDNQRIFGLGSQKLVTTQ